MSAPLDLSSLPKDFVPNSQSLAKVYPRAIAELARPMPGIHLQGWDAFNRMVGGLRPNEYSILCGPTGCGKTTLLSNWSQLMVQANVRHYVMSIETGETDWVKRAMSAAVGKDMNTGDAVPVDVLRAFDQHHGEPFRGENVWLSLYERRIPLDRLKQELVYHCLKLGCKVAMIDNLSYFLDLTLSAKNPVLEMDRVTSELIDLVKGLPMHVIMVMHPKKLDGGRVEHEDHIKGSSTAVQEAHNVFLFNRPREEDLKSENAKVGDRELKLLKMRRRGAYVGRRIFLECLGSRYTERIMRKPNGEPWDG